MKDEAVDEMIERRGLKKFTPKMTTGASKLKKRLEGIRRRGFGIADGEYKPDLRAVAVPIRDHTGRVVASLMTAIQSARSGKDKKLVESLIAVLKRDAKAISRRIGYEKAVGED